MVASILLAVLMRPGAGDEVVPELGRVAWGRDLDEATRRAEKERRPLLVLFQEVPG